LAKKTIDELPLESEFQLPKNDIVRLAIKPWFMTKLYKSEVVANYSMDDILEEMPDGWAEAIPGVGGPAGGHSSGDHGSDVGWEIVQDVACTDCDCLNERGQAQNDGPRCAENSGAKDTAKDFFTSKLSLDHAELCFQYKELSLPTNEKLTIEKD
jgi:hypothetical protein